MSVDENDGYMCASLLPRMYEGIENRVVELYKELGINKLPIDPFKIAKQKDYKLIPFSTNGKIRDMFSDRELDGASCCGFYGGYYIGYDDTSIYQRQRFTIMHEIGHILLGHKEESDLADKMANYFASYALAPSPLVWLFKCDDYIDVKNIFNVSNVCADVVFNRYTKWQLSHKVRDYESELLRLFNK